MYGPLVPVTSLIYFNAKILIYYKENNFTKAYTTMRKRNQNSGARPSTVSEINGIGKTKNLHNLALHHMISVYINLTN